MKEVGAFELAIEPETTSHPLRVSLCLMGAKPDERGLIRLSPNCLRLDELEGVINRRQDELDLLRVRAREAFASTTGHA